MGRTQIQNNNIVPLGTEYSVPNGTVELNYRYNVPSGTVILNAFAITAPLSTFLSLLLVLSFGVHDRWWRCKIVQALQSVR